MMFRKYHNKKVTLPDGQKFDSQKEYTRWLELSALQKAGEITNLRRQVKYELVPAQKKRSGKTERAITYIADFVYGTPAGEVVEDSKGMRTKEYIQKRKLMLYFHGIEILET